MEFQRIKEMYRSKVDLKYVSYPGGFNYSEAINLGVNSSIFDKILVLNDDIKFLPESKLENLLLHLDMPDVGGVGVKLLDFDGNLRHAGIEFHSNEPRHFLEGSAVSYMGAAQNYCREVSGVTAACLFMNKKDFLKIGQMKTEFQLDYGDVELMLNFSRNGYYNLYCPEVVAFHYESMTRNRTKVSELSRELTKLKLIHGELPLIDPYLYTPAERKQYRVQ
jgi:GT2 family glycosyltransferase